jgi:PiT family inorganic phosphate transporter
VAFTNGANANFKGVASLYACGTASLKTALRWGTWTTLAGSLTALFLANSLLKNFSGRGLVQESLTRTPPFLLAVAAGASLTSFLATRLSFPVSTTHALVGALVGAGAFADWPGLNLHALEKSFVQPLLWSPFLAILVGMLLRTLTANLKPQPWVDTAHFLSAGAASFARGLNDTPKMVALLLALGSISPKWGFLIIALFIAAGAGVDAMNVAERLGKKVAGMNPVEGLAANLATSILVTTASLHSLPVSTTHVSVGAMLGIGMGNGRALWRSVLQIVLAWLTTLPVAAAIAATTYWAVSRG